MHMNNNQNIQNYHPDIASIIYGSYIRYDRLFEMTKFAFYGKTDSNDVNIFIDAYSILKNLYARGDNITIDDSCVVASCIINLAIHIRAYFESRHRVYSKVYIIYGGSRPIDPLSKNPVYNNRNIQMEDSNFIISKLIKDNMDIIKIICPYLDDIFAIVDYENEFSTIASYIIDQQEDKVPNIIYSKEPLAYQLVAFKPRTFMYRPKKRSNLDCSWVVTKSTLYNAYRYAELGLTKEIPCNLNVQMFSIYQTIAGVKTRSLPSYKNGNAAATLLEKAVQNGIFNTGYNAGSILRSHPNPFESMFADSNLYSATPEMVNRFLSIDLPNQTMIYSTTPNSIDIKTGIINLYNPQEVRNINDKYFQKYPLDLNRV